jgi:hypothetical protein
MVGLLSVNRSESAASRPLENWKRVTF